MKMLLLHLITLDGHCILNLTRKPPADSPQHNTTIKGSWVTWRVIQLSTFLRLSYILIAQPQTAHNALPQIWLDGLSNLIGAVVPATSAAFGHRYTELNEDEMYEVGWGKVRDLAYIDVGERGYGARRGELKEMDENCVVEMWKTLRHVLWSDGH